MLGGHLKTLSDDAGVQNRPNSARRIALLLIDFQQKLAVATTVAVLKVIVFCVRTKKVSVHKQCSVEKLPNGYGSRCLLGSALSCEHLVGSMGGGGSNCGVCNVHLTKICLIVEYLIGFTGFDQTPEKVPNRLLSESDQVAEFCNIKMIYPV